MKQSFGSRETLSLEIAVDPPTTVPHTGSITIFIRNVNVTQHRSGTTDSDSVTWELEPIASWLGGALGAMLNEEALPLAIDRSSSGSEWLRRSAKIPVRLTEAQEDAWIDARQGWFDRHALRAVRDGGPWPPLMIRRLGDNIELSWDHVAFPPARRSIGFDNKRGLKFVPVDTVAEVLSEASEWLTGVVGSTIKASQHRQTKVPPWLWLLPERLRDDVQQDNVWASQLASGCKLTSNGLVAQFSVDTKLLAELPPDTRWRDAKKLLETIQTPVKPTSMALSGLDHLRMPNFSHRDQPWESGYEVARKLLRSQSIPKAMSSAQWLNDEFGAMQKSLEVESGVDGSIDGACVWSDSTGSIVRNTLTPRYSANFFLAKCLGHFVMDSRRSQTYAHTSSTVESWPEAARARAFAALLLMPDRDVESAFPKGKAVTKGQIVEFAMLHQVSPVTASNHLVNLGAVSKIDADRMFDA